MKIEIADFPTATGKHIERLQILPENGHEKALMRRMWEAMNHRRLPLPDAHYGDLIIDGKETAGFRLDNELPFNPYAPETEVVADWNTADFQ